MLATGCEFDFPLLKKESVPGLYDCVPSTGEAEVARILEFTGQPTLKKKKSAVSEEWQLSLYLIPTSMHMHTEGRPSSLLSQFCVVLVLGCSRFQSHGCQLKALHLCLSSFGGMLSWISWVFTCLSWALGKVFLFVCFCFCGRSVSPLSPPHGYACL